jgi:hypothetical protein
MHPDVEKEIEAVHREHLTFHASPDKYALFTLLMAKGEKSKEYH